MAAEDISGFRDELPKAFQDLDPPDTWDDFHIIPIDVEGESAFDLDEIAAEIANADATDLVSNMTHDVDFSDDGLDPDDVFLDRLIQEAKLPSDADYGLIADRSFPGSPRPWSGDYLPPTDALAFYLPFHYYHPDHWGIYIIVEGLEDLSQFLLRHAKGRLHGHEATVGARLFLYHHEAFHHKVESMATRLEVTHRRPLYRRGFQELYDRTLKTDQCLEEALANAYAYRKVEQSFRDKGWDTRHMLNGLKAFIEGQPPGYNQALEFVDTDEFVCARDEFAEECHRESIEIIPLDRRVWRLFGYAFTGITRINSHTNYVINRGSPLVNRVPMDRRCISYRKLKKRLDGIVGLRLKRQGNGSHEIYVTESGNTVTIPHTTGDIAKGTLGSILKQAGIGMTVYDFLRYRG
jgi:predicted RNA binding protein YcfA (HicA-like mRNA interferase family)